MKISSFFKKFNHEKNLIKNYPNTNIFSYKNALYPHELNPEINPVIQDVYEYLKRQNSNIEKPSIRTTYKFVDSNNNEIFATLENGLKLLSEVCSLKKNPPELPEDSFVMWKNKS